MSGLAFAQAPPPSHPLRFLLAAAGWGVAAGLWLAVHGDAALLSRWAPATLVLVHMLALGLLGNAMLGSLVQFLPAAAGSPLPWPRAVPPLHLAFNAGIACLLPSLLPAVAGSRIGSGLATTAIVLLAGSLGVFAIALLLALARGCGERLARAGIALALGALLATLALGVALLAVRSGWLATPAVPLVDLHATYGLAGWVLGLLAAVAAIVLPMLQGTPSPPRLARMLWLALLAGVLLAAPMAMRASPVLAGAVVALPVAVFAGAVLWLQWRSPHRRNAVLRRFWTLGCVALLAAAAVLALPLPWPGGSGVLAGVLALGIGLPALTLGMALEITAFLAWIELRRRVPRGTKVPGVGRLLDEADKRRVLWLHGIASLALLAAAAHPLLAPGAGLLLALACAAALQAMWRCWNSAIRHEA